MDVIVLSSPRVFVNVMVQNPKNVKLMDAPNKRKEISKECAVSLELVVIVSRLSFRKLMHRPFPLFPFAEAHFRESSAPNKTATVLHTLMNSSVSSPPHDTNISIMIHVSSYQTNGNIDQQSGNYCNNPYYDHLPHPNTSLSYGVPALAPQPFPYQQPYPAQQQAWLMPSNEPPSNQYIPDAALAATEVPNVYYDPGSLERNTFSPETEPLEPICEATSFLRRDSIASLNIHHQLESHPSPPRGHPNAPATSAVRGSDDELSLPNLDGPDDGLSVMGGPYMEV
jgi:hypothetical protein